LKWKKASQPTKRTAADKQTDLPINGKQEQSSAPIEEINLIKEDDKPKQSKQRTT
jgi:hypothetical protein